MLEGRWMWIGVGAVLAASVSFVNKVINVRRGNEPSSAMIDETLQDVGIACLGVSLMFEKGTPQRIYLMLGFVVLFGGNVIRRMLAYRRERAEGMDGE
jgi:hypothetical protein